MKKRFKSAAFLMLALTLILGIFAGCGDVTDQDPKIWPKKGPAASVPEPEAGEVAQALTKEDVDGKVFSIISIDNFTAEDMGDYIRLLLKKGFETYYSQRADENYITYSAKKGNKLVSLRLDTDKNELKIEIE